MVVAREHQHAAVLGRPGEVRVLEHVAAAVDPRPLAVPHREHAVVLGAGIKIDLLAAPDRGCREVLVQSGLELDLRASEEFLGAPQRNVESSQWRSAIARYETGG